MALAVAEKGYAATTIADIVAAAGVSRRTFYEHFKSRAECLVALYEASSRNVLQVLRDAVDPAQPWPFQVDRALGAYFEAMAANPVLLRTLFIEILGLGTDGLSARRRVNQDIADFMLEVINGPVGRRAGAPGLAPEMAVAVVGGINELVLWSIERRREALLVELVAPAAALVRAVAGHAG
jgi:AcrR family transcriptional regulator